MGTSTMKGSSDVLVGLQYGDEGKARIIDMLAKDYEVIARFNGGANAGHTIETEHGRIALHQIPSGVFYPDMLLYIGSGCVVNIEKLVHEIKDVNRLGIDLTNRLHISSQSTLIQPHHLIIDELSDQVIGTTRNGIGPAYSDRAMRMDGERLLHIRLGDFLDNPSEVLGQVEKNLLHVVKSCDLNNVDTNIMQKFDDALSAITPYVEIDTMFMDKLARSGKRIMFEGAQSFMLDVVKGTIPYVTSSHTVTSHAYTGGDLSLGFHRKTIGVAKAIMSRVGYGPFVSEFGGEDSERYCMEQDGRTHSKEYESHLDVQRFLKSSNMLDIGIALRIIGNEYGVATGRPRRIGMMDIVQLAYAARMNGVDELAINKCDMLRDFSETALGGIPIVNKYSLHGQTIDYVPASSHTYKQVASSHLILDPFEQDISTITEYNHLPKPAKNFVRMVESALDCKVIGLGVGPKRDQYVVKSG